MPKTRTSIPADLSAESLFLSDRTCCVCREPGKRVQIHHVDDNPCNNIAENFAVLCFECHDLTQIRGGFGKHLTEAVVRKYRDEWLLRVVLRRDEADRFAVSKMAGGTVIGNAQGPNSQPNGNLFTYLDAVPEIRKALLAIARPDWDSDVTATMNQATYNYIDGLQGVLVKLASYYPLESFGGEDPHYFFSDIISSRFRWHRAYAEPSGPGTGGTIVGTICSGSVKVDVENMVVDMVMSLIGYGEECSWKRWERQWKSAVPE